MLVAYMAAGYAPTQFWESTFNEVALHMRAAKLRDEYDQNARMALAHTIAVLSRTDRMPPLERLLVGDQKKTAETRTREEVRSSWRAFAMATGVTSAQWAAAEKAAQARRRS